MSISLFEEFIFDTKTKLYRGVSKHELVSACQTGTLMYTSSDGHVSLTPNMDFARKFSNYVVEVDCQNVNKISYNEYKADSPSDCTIVNITEFDTVGNIIGEYNISDFCKLSNETH